MTEKKTAKTKKQTTKKKQDSKTKKVNTKNSSFKKEFDVLTDKHIRLKAEFENFRKRKNKEISSLLQYDGESVLKEVLPIPTPRISNNVEKILLSANEFELDLEVVVP